MKDAAWSLVSLCFIISPGIACAQTTRPSTTQPATDEFREPTDQDWKDLAAEIEAFRKNPPKTPEEIARARAAHAKLAGMALLEAKSNFRLRGEVVDESGKRLEGVRMVVTRSMAPHMVPGPEVVAGRSETEEKMIDGTFDVSARGWWGVSVAFRKDGYEIEQIGLTSLMDQGAVQRMLLQRGVEPSTVVKEGLKIELVKRMVPSPTVSTAERRITVNADGSLQYVIFGQFEKERFPGGMANVLPLKESPTSVPSDQLPKDAFTLEQSAKDGKFLPSTKRFSAFTPPQSITLRLNAPGGGLLLYEPRRLNFGIDILREAPETGYTAEIVIRDGQEEMKRITRQRGLFFYFKSADGKYGKGFLEGTFGMASGKAEYYVKVFLQTDGTRNVQTDRVSEQ